VRGGGARLVDGRAVALVHLVELVDAADALVRQHQRAALQHLRAPSAASRPRATAVNPILNPSSTPRVLRHGPGGGRAPARPLQRLRPEPRGAQLQTVGCMRGSISPVHHHRAARSLPHPARHALQSCRGCGGAGACSRALPSAETRLACTSTQRLHVNSLSAITLSTLSSPLFRVHCPQQQREIELGPGARGGTISPVMGSRCTAAVSPTPDEPLPVVYTARGEMCAMCLISWLLATPGSPARRGVRRPLRSSLPPTTSEASSRQATAGAVVTLARAETP